MNQWFVTRDGQEYGPLSAEQLKTLVAKGRLRPPDLVRREDMAAPRPAREVKGLSFAEQPAAIATPDESGGSPSRRPAVIAFLMIPLLLGGLLGLSLWERASRRASSAQPEQQVEVHAAVVPSDPSALYEGFLPVVPGRVKVYRNETFVTDHLGRALTGAVLDRPGSLMEREREEWREDSGGRMTRKITTEYPKPAPGTTAYADDDHVTREGQFVVFHTEPLVKIGAHPGDVWDSKKAKWRFVGFADGSATGAAMKPRRVLIESTMVMPMATNAGGTVDVGWRTETVLEEGAGIVRQRMWTGPPGSPANELVTEKTLISLDGREL